MAFLQNVRGGGEPRYRPLKSDRPKERNSLGFRGRPVPRLVRVSRAEEFHLAYVCDRHPIKAHDGIRAPCVSPPLLLFFLLYLRLSASLTTTPLNGNNEKARTRKYTVSRNSASSDGVGYSHGIIIISQPHSEVTYIRKREPRSFMNWK